MTDNLIKAIEAAKVLSYEELKALISALNTKAYYMLDKQEEKIKALLNT